MLTIISAHSPAYSDPDHQHVSLMVKFQEFEEELPFNATPHDSMPYGVELFNRAIAGEFGTIIDFDVAHPGVREALANTANQPQPTVQGAQTL